MPSTYFISSLTKSATQDGCVQWQPYFTLRNNHLISNQAAAGMDVLGRWKALGVWENGNISACGHGVDLEAQMERAASIMIEGAGHWHSPKMCENLSQWSSLFPAQCWSWSRNSQSLNNDFIMTSTITFRFIEQNLKWASHSEAETLYLQSTSNWIKQTKVVTLVCECKS